MSIFSIDTTGLDYRDYLNEPHILKVMYEEGKFSLSELSGKTTTFSGCTEDTFLLMVALANVGAINLSDYWNVGDERNISISAITGSSNTTGFAVTSQSAVTMPMVLANAGGKKLATMTAGGRITCEFVILSKKMLNTYAAMQNVNNSTTVKCYGNNYGGWACSAIRGYYNTYIFNALPEYLQKALKPHKSIRGKGGGSNTSGTITTIDKLGMPAERNVFASNTYSQQDEWNALVSDGEVQWTYYQTANNRKHYTVSGTSYNCWLSSPNYNNANNFCNVNTDGTANNNNAYNANGLAFFGCK